MTATHPQGARATRTRRDAPKRSRAAATTLLALLALACEAATTGTDAGTGKEGEKCLQGLFCDEGLVCVLGYCLTDHDETGTGDETSALCGNGMIDADAGEQCDTDALADASCSALGYDAGTLACGADCLFDLATCMNDPQPPSGQLYSHCLDNSGCPGLDGCLTIVDDMQIVVDGFCTNFCAMNSECNGIATGGSAMPLCHEGVQSTFCALDCAGGLTCPQGMSCETLESGDSLCF